MRQWILTASALALACGTAQAQTAPGTDEDATLLDRIVVTTPLATLALAKPQKKDRVRVVAGDDNRGAAAELIGVDGADGVVKVDRTKDISIHEIGALARIWVG